MSYNYTMKILKEQRLKVILIIGVSLLSSFETFSVVDFFICLLVNKSNQGLISEIDYMLICGHACEQFWLFKMWAAAAGIGSSILQSYNGISEHRWWMDVSSGSHLSQLKNYATTDTVT